MNRVMMNSIKTVF